MSTQQFSTTLTDVILKAAVDAWRDDQPDPKPTRAEALKLALTDWLTGMGYVRPADDPEMAN